MGKQLAERRGLRKSEPNRTKESAMEKTFDALLTRMQELKDLGGLIGLATWDQETYLPPKAEPVPGRAALHRCRASTTSAWSTPRLGELLA